MITDPAIVSDMDIGHQQVIAAYLGQTTTTDGSTVDRNALTNSVAIADLQAGRLTSIFKVLRRLANGGKLVDLVISTNRCGPLMTT